MFFVVALLPLDIFPPVCQQNENNMSMDSSAPAVAMCNTVAYSKFSYCKNISVWLLSKADVRICVNVYLCTKIVAHFKKHPTYEMPTLKYETSSCRTETQK